jgi:hypothetical protein
MCFLWCDYRTKKSADEVLPSSKTVTIVVTSQRSMEDDENSHLFSHMQDKSGPEELRAVRSTRRSNTAIRATMPPSVPTGQVHNVKIHWQSSFHVAALEERSMVVPSTAGIDFSCLF